MKYRRDHWPVRHTVSLATVSLVIATLLLVAVGVARSDPPASAASKINESVLTVRVRGPKNEAALKGVRCVLTRPATGEVVARFDAPKSPGKLKVQANDVLLVYRRGFDLHRVVLTEAQAKCDVVLTPSTRQCVVEVKASADVNVQYDLTVWCTVPSPQGGRALLTDQFSVPLHTRTARIAVPAGMRCDITGGGKDVILWPRTVLVPVAAPDAPQDWVPKITLNWEPAWTPILRVGLDQQQQREANPDGPAPDPRAIEFFPDYSVVPKGTPAQIDAWKYALNRADWGRSAPWRDGMRIRICPAIPFHVVATVDGRTIVRRVVPGGDVLDLREIADARALGGTPIVNGRPVPLGTRIVPGKLDEITAAAFIDIDAQHLGLLAWLTGPEDAARLKLPPARWVTVYNPDFGIAHLAWKEGEVPRGRPHPGSMVIRAPKGWRLHGKLTTYPLWKGAGRVRTIPPMGHLERDVDSVSEVRFPGLPLGRRAFFMQIMLVEMTTGREHEIQYTYKVEITAARSNRIYNLNVPARK